MMEAMWEDSVIEYPPRGGEQVKVKGVGFTPFFFKVKGVGLTPFFFMTSK